MPRIKMNKEKGIFMQTKLVFSISNLLTVRLGHLLQAGFDRYKLWYINEESSTITINSSQANNR